MIFFSEKKTNKKGVRSAMRRRMKKKHLPGRFYRQTVASRKRVLFLPAPERPPHCLDVRKAICLHCHNNNNILLDDKNDYSGALTFYRQSQV